MKNENCKYKVAVCNEFGSVEYYIRCKNEDEVTNIAILLGEKGKLFKGYIDGALYVKHVNL